MRVVTTPQGICRFGIAHGDITPPVGIYCRMWGAARHDRATGVHRPLLSTAMVFRPPAETANEIDRDTQILVALDHCLLGGKEMQALLQRVAGQTGIEEEIITIVFSHTHSAGLMSLDRTELPGGDLIPAYLDQVADCVAELIGEARQDLQEATIVYGGGRCDLAAHRDYWDEAAEQFVCGFNPDQPADDTLVLARVTDEDGKLLATLVNYACHPTTLAWQNSLISPDFPGATRDMVEQATDAPCVFLQGASGELGPREGFLGNVEVAERNGRRLGYAALAALEALPPPRTQFQYAGSVVSGATIGTWSHVELTRDQLRQKAHLELKRFTVDLPYGDLPSIETVRQRRARWQAKEVAARGEGNEDHAAECRAYVERCTRRLARLEALPAGETFPYEVVLWRVGDGFWVAVEGEPYSQLQIRLRERFADSPILVCTLAGGSRPAYLPPQELYGRGIYQEKAAVLAPGGLEKLTEAIAESLELWIE